MAGEAQVPSVISRELLSRSCASSCHCAAAFLAENFADVAAEGALWIQESELLKATGIRA